ncbi:MAG: SPASM domain-containing protein, partial [Anaeromyxobacteraceae bacterium]
RAIAGAAAERLRGRMEVVLVAPDWQAGRPVACMEGWGRRTIVVAPDGRVLPCHLASTLPLEFESVRDRPLGAIWTESPAIGAFRGETALPAQCRGCALHTRDHGGCRCQAFHLTGDLRAVDPACADAPHHGVVLEARARAEEPAADLVPLIRRAAPS